MGELERPIGRAWRRLRLQRFLEALAWSLFAGLLIATVVFGLGRFRVATIPGAEWMPFVVAGSLSLAVAVLVAALTGPSRMEAAVAVDHAFQLQERLSTALSLPTELHDTRAGQAVLQDAQRHAAALDIPSQFRLRLPRRSWLPVIPAALALGLLAVPPEWVRRSARAVTTTETKLDETKAADRAKALSKNIAEVRKDLDKGEFGETDKLLAEIEKFAQDLAQKPPTTKEKALLELNKLTEALQERQKQLGSTDQVMKQLQQLKDMSADGPAEEFSKELARGDFSKAAEQVKQLRDKLQAGKLSEAEKEALKKQLGEMAEQLQKLANLEERKKMLEEARKNGGLTQEQYKQEMQKLNAQAEDLKKLQQLAQQLAQAQQAMQQGDMNKAANSLGMTQEQLQQLAQQVQELETLDSAMAEMLESKAGLSGDSLNQLGEGMDSMGNMAGNRMGTGQGNQGRGRGAGDRPEAPDDVSAYNTRTPQQYTKGAAVVTGFAPPKGLTPGQSIADVQQEQMSTEAGVAEAMSNQKVPTSVKKHVLGYFDQIRKGN